MVQAVPGPVAVPVVAVDLDGLAPTEPKTASDMWGIVVQAFTGSGELPLEFRLAMIGLIAVAATAILATAWGIWWTSPKRPWNSDDTLDPFGRDASNDNATSAVGPLCLSLLVSSTFIPTPPPADTEAAPPQVALEPVEDAAEPAPNGWFAPPPKVSIAPIGVDEMASLDR